jgi:D-xylose transport system substrate-binding protein
MSVMALLKPITAKGTGKVGVLLPSPVTSARWSEFDPPLLKEAFSKAGLPASDLLIQNADTDAQQFTQAQADIAQGAKVLLIRDEDPGVGIRIDTYAHANGVTAIDYDTLTAGGSAREYVSFNNVAVGALIGQGFVSCINAWNLRNPGVVVFHGALTDNNATLFYDGYMGVLKPYFSSHKYTLVGLPAATWTPSVMETEFQQEYTAHPNFNAAVVPNDETAAPIISFLQSRHTPPKSFPITGQDATLVGLQNTLAGYQCGTAYKPIFLLAQGAATEALYARAGVTPPAGTLNGTITDPVTHRGVPSILLKAEWVTTANMNATIIKDKFVPASQLCAGQYASYCKAAGIKP